MATVESLLPSLPNLRDLGGHPTRDGGRVRAGAVFRSESPGLARPADALALHHRLGIAEVIDLRREEEQLERPLPAGLLERARWRRVPFEVAAPPHVVEQVGAGPVTCEQMARFYAWMAQRNTEPLRQVLQAVAEAEQPVLIHCAVGKDRTGVVCAVLLLAAGVTESVAIADYGRTDATVNAVLPRHDAALTPERIAGDVRLRAPEDAMRGCLATLAEAHGSVEGFLDAFDPDGSLRRRLRERLVERP